MILSARESCIVTEISPLPMKLRAVKFGLCWRQGSLWCRIHRDTGPRVLWSPREDPPPPFSRYEYYLVIDSRLDYSTLIITSHGGSSNVHRRKPRPKRSILSYVGGSYVLCGLWTVALDDATGVTCSSQISLNNDLFVNITVVLVKRYSFLAMHR